MTGLFLRVYRNGVFENLEIEDLTEDEIYNIFIHQPPSEIIKWLTILALQVKQIDTYLQQRIT